MNLHHVIISLAANRCQKPNLAKARQCLSDVLADVVYTAELWTEPVNSPRTDLYLNQLCAATTTLPLSELNQWLKQVELRFGRTAGRRQQGIVPIDLDVLLYDGQQYHLTDWHRPYVLTLIGQLPDNTLPIPLPTPEHQKSC